MSDNAYERILPARYLCDGEDPEDLFPRVAANIALAEIAHADEDIYVRPADVKPDHPSRTELVAEICDGVSESELSENPDGTFDLQGEDWNPKIELTPENVSKFSWNSVTGRIIDEQQESDSVIQDADQWRRRFQEMMSDLKFIPNSPTLMNAGDELQQLSACFVDSPADDITDIHQTAKEAAEVFQSGGGMGYAFWQLRPYGDQVGSTDGIASGPITFMRTYDQMCETIAQGGARRGAQMGIMRVSHPDVIQFIHAKNKDVSLANSLRLNDPDDFTHNSFNEALDEAREILDRYDGVPEMFRNAVEGHLSNFNISVGITNDFMEAVQNDELYTFTNPQKGGPGEGEPHIATEETKQLYERFDLGEYVEVGEPLEIPAREIWDDIIDGAHENGEPGVVYLERINKEHSFDVEENPNHRILATNPCLTGDMEVQLADGTTQQIGDLADRDSRVSVRTLDGGDVTSNPATAFRTKKNADIVRVETESGLTIRTTPDHEIRAADGTWVEVQDLKTGDNVVGLSQLRATPQGPVQETTTETVVGVEFDGSEDVYDLSVDSTHNFFASESGKGNLNVHNCGEQPLEEYEACNLGHINLSTIVDEDTVNRDWREFNPGRGSGRSQSHIVGQFLDQAIDWQELDNRIRVGTRFLENVVTMSDFPVPEIEEKVQEMRKIGLGIMGYAQLLPQLGIEYGTPEGNEVARQLMTHINHTSKGVSSQISDERGVFDEWDDSKYADPTEYREWFEKQTGEDADDWEDGFPMRNHNTTTIAPTGTTSMVGNTSGGCEPIFDVIYRKNVSQDVQGEEMLAEADDYFLRVLEANGIDSEAVLEEADRQIRNNEFDGINGLDRVPNQLKELFVTSGDLTAKQHASVQCAFQEGVDSAISKTCNFPHEATKADMKEVYEYIWDNGGKGVTVYRDGTRSKQVLTTRQDNKQFSQLKDDFLLDEIEARTADNEFTEELFQRVADNDDQTDAEDLVAEIWDIDVAAGDEDLPWYENGHYAKKRARPDVLHGTTQRVDTGYGKLYVNINVDDEGRPFELFVNTGNSGGFTNGFVEAVAKTASTALRSGVNPQEIANELQGIQSPNVGYDQQEQITSIPDAIGTALERFMEKDVEKIAGVDATTTPEPEEEIEVEDDGGIVQKLVQNGEMPECPECGAMSLYYSEGCKTCESCGWSEC